MGTKRQPSSSTHEGRKPDPPPITKRQRVSRACDQCRSAREKCDGVQPTCFPCASLNRSCTWEEPKKKRGVQMGYIRTLELALGWIFDKVPGSEKALHDLVTHESGQGRALLEGKDSGVGNRLYRRWRKSMVYQEIDRVLSGSDSAPNKSTKIEMTESDDEQDAENQANSSPTGLGNNIGQSLKPLRAAMSVASDLPSNSSPSEVLSPPSRPLIEQQPTANIRLPTNHWRLFDVYFAYTHSWFPIVEKHVVLKTAYAYPKEGLNPAQISEDCAGHAELWAAFALASHQEEANQVASGAVKEAEKGSVSTAALFKTARDLATKEDGEVSARRVNALILLSLVRLAQDDAMSSWLLIGAATRMALMLGLHKPSIHNQEWTIAHTYMGCFILDTLISKRLDLPPHLRSDDTQLSVPASDRDIDEWQPWTPCSDFGPQNVQALPSRSPSHSISTFGALFETYRMFSSTISSRNGFVARDIADLGNQIGHVLRGRNMSPSFQSFITSGNNGTINLPSIYILRLTYLCICTQVIELAPQTVSDLMRCIEDYISIFGSASLPPILTSYMAIAKDRFPSESLLPDDQQRWTGMETTLRAVWKKSPSETRAANNSTTTGFVFGPLNGRIGPVSLDNSTPYLPTPASFTLPEHPHHHHHRTASLSHTSRPIYQQQHISDSRGVYCAAPSHHLSAERMVVDASPSSSGTTTAALYPAPQGTTTTNTTMPLVSPPTPQLSMNNTPAPPVVAPPGQQQHAALGNALMVDYDAILDDIASIDRADVVDSDPQFMTNLGFAPGSNLSELFSHDYVEFP